MKALLIIGSPRENSICQKTAQTAINIISKNYGSLESETINLYDLGLHEFSKNYMIEYFSEPKPKTESDEKQEKIRENLLKKFVSNDIVVISIPKYNFSYPIPVKAFIDTLYKYKVTYDPSLPKGEKGLLKQKKELIVITTAGDDNSNTESGLEKSIFEAFEYLSLDKSLKIIPFSNIYALSEEEIEEILIKKLT